MQTTCCVIKAESPHESKQGLPNFRGISGANTGAQGICMHLVTIPPGGRAKAHLHENHETVMYILQGEGSMWYGENLAEHLTVKAGEYLYIPAGVPHLPYNPSATEPAVAVVARTDPNEEESVVLLPKLDSVH
ncbi:MAG: cupin domain-containing protein [Caldilineaceae bacterium]